MRWLDRLLSRQRDPVARRIESVTREDTRVELEGEVEALGLLHDPLTGQAAVILNYRARRPGLAPRYFGIQDSGGALDAFQATNFLLVDGGGMALIEVAPGSDIAALHRRLSDEFGVDLRASTEHIGPGDRIRVRGRVRAWPDEQSPHRREPWSVIVRLDEVERA